MSGAYYLPLWTDAYLGDTKHLSTLQHGAYLLLLMAMWRNGGTLPNEEKRLARIVGLTPDRWRKIQKEVLEFMTVEGENIVQKRLELELEKTSDLAGKRKATARAGAEAKWRKNKDPALLEASPEQCSTDAIQIQIQNQIQIQKPSLREGTAIAVSDDGQAADGQTLTTAEAWQAAFGEPLLVEPEPPEENTLAPPAVTRQRRPDSDYALRVGDFRILKADAAALEQAYRYIDVPAELMAASGWAIEKWGRAKWWGALKGYLRNKNETARVAELDRRTRAEVQVEVAGKPQRSRFQL